MWSERGPVTAWSARRSGSGGHEVERPVRPVAVVGVDEDAEHPLEVAAVDDQEPIETFGSSRADEAFGDRVRLRGSHRCADDLDPFALEDGVEVARELAVAIPDQEANRRRAHESPSELTRLLGPSEARAGRSTTVFWRWDRTSRSTLPCSHAPVCVSGSLPSAGGHRARVRAGSGALEEALLSIRHRKHPCPPLKTPNCRETLGPWADKPRASATRLFQRSQGETHFVHRGQVARSSMQMSGSRQTARDRAITPLPSASSLEIDFVRSCA
jgi:hypothetical protein